MKITIVKPIFALLLILFAGCNGPENDSLIVGKWKVADSEILPFGHISYCDGLTVNSIFEFTAGGKLKIFVSDSKKTNCNKDQSYAIFDEKLQITESDMIFNYGLVKLTKDSLVLNIRYLSREMRLDTELTFPQLDSIQKTGFNVTLLKVN